MAAAMAKHVAEWRFEPEPECPACDGLGWDLKSGGPCGTCGGTGQPADRCGKCGYRFAAIGHQRECGDKA